MQNEPFFPAKKKKTRLRRALLWAGSAAAVCVAVLGAAGFAAWKLSPNSLTVTETSGVSVPAGWYQISMDTGSETPASARSESPREAQVRLLGVIPVKTISVRQTNQPEAVLCGTPFGMKLEASGVVVVGTADISTGGTSVNPASEAGLKIGDVIYSAGGQAVTENSQLAKIFEASRGKPVTVEAERGGKEFTAVLKPVYSEIDGQYKGGLWVRDSTAGIGTLTFYEPETGVFGGLGHGICDVDTNELIPLGSGEILPVAISGIVPGQRGTAGELQGYFSSDLPMGELTANTDTGVYGVLSQPPEESETLPIAMKQEVKAGKAQICTTIDGSGPHYYDIEIESVNYDESRLTKNLVIRVTDSALLEKTGGIIQGLSGSPIIQNGKLVGAVTHVLLNEPEKGYGIFAETMWQSAHAQSSQNAA